MDRSDASRSVELGHRVALVALVVGCCQLVSACTTCEVNINAEEISKTEIETSLSERPKGDAEEQLWSWY